MTLIYFILILGVIVFIHEFGHFIFAKKAGVYVYEFAIGMGPKIWSKKSKKSETEYSLRLIPIGGFCAMAGEDEEDSNVPKEKNLGNKTKFQRFMVLFAGPMMNFILAFVLLFLYGLIAGAYEVKPVVGSVIDNSPAYKAGIRKGDRILEINDKKIGSWDSALIELQFIEDDKVTFTVERNDTIKDIDIAPKKEKNDDGTVTYFYGISQDITRSHNVLDALEFSCDKLVSLTSSMVTIIKGLFTGRIGISSMSGPVGIFEIVGTQAESGLSNLVYLTAYLSINVGFINLIPFPAFDGGRILLLFIEAIRRKKITPKVEATINNIGFILLMILMLVVTGNDIFRIIR